MAYPYYNNMNYPQYPQMQGVQNVPLQNQMQQNNGIIWVQGEGAAKSYLVAPGCTVALFDNESQTIYIKSADASEDLEKLMNKTDDERVKDEIRRLMERM